MHGMEEFSGLVDFTVFTHASLQFETYGASTISILTDT